jgi:hypothetical protein
MKNGKNITVNIGIQSTGLYAKPFDDVINRTIFKKVKERVKFVDYENTGNQYSKMYELSQVRQLI